MAKNNFYGLLALLGIVGLIAGFFTKLNYILYIGFALIAIGFVIFAFRKFSYDIRSKSAIKKFIQKFPQSDFAVGEDFSNNYGKIPFDKIKCLAVPNSSIKIFQNKYPVRMGFNKFTMENQMCFLMQINKLTGYHHIIEKNTASGLTKGTTEFFTGGKSPEIKSDIDEIDTNFILLSNNGGECKKLVSRIYSELIELQNVFKKMDFVVSVDNIATNFDIQAKNNSFLFRISYPAGFLVEDIYPILINIQKKLRN
jgi:hypothetical protein